MAMFKFLSFTNFLSNKITSILPNVSGTPLINSPNVRTYYADWRMIKDLRKRKAVRMYAKDRLRVNSLRKNKILPKAIQEIADKEIAAFPSDSSITKVVCRCILTSRPRGVVRRWRISRIMFRHLADYNYLSGVQRAMW